MQPEGLGKMKKKIHSPHRVSNPRHSVTKVVEAAKADIKAVPYTDYSY
jgi:hypothetical protein